MSTNSVPSLIEREIAPEHRDLIERMLWTACELEGDADLGWFGAIAKARSVTRMELAKDVRDLAALAALQASSPSPVSAGDPFDAALADTAVPDFLAAIMERSPNGETVAVKYHPNGDWSVYDAPVSDGGDRDELVARLQIAADDIIDGETIFSDRVHGLLEEAAQALTQSPPPAAQVAQPPVSDGGAELREALRLFLDSFVDETCVDARRLHRAKARAIEAVAQTPTPAAQVAPAGVGTDERPQIVAWLRGSDAAILAASSDHLGLPKTAVGALTSKAALRLGTVRIACMTLADAIERGDHLAEALAKAEGR